MNRLKQYLTYIIILTFPIMSIIDFFGVFKFNTALSDIFVIFLGIIYLIDIKNFSFKKNFTYWWYFLSLLCVVALSNIFAMSNSLISNGSIMMLINESLKIIIIAVYFFAGYNSIHTEENMKKVIQFWIEGLWVFMIVGLYSTISTWMGKEIIKWHNTLGSDSRLLGTLTDANAAALYLSISFFIVLFYYHTLINKRNEKIYCAITMTFTVLCLVFTLSRGGLIGFSIGFIFYLIVNIKRLYKKIYIIPILITLSLMIINVDTNYFNNYFYNTFIGRSQDVLEGTGMFETRKNLSFSSLNMGLDHPILGVGRGNFSLNSKSYLISQGVNWEEQGDFYKDLIPHNTLVGIFAEMGVIGLLIFISLFIFMFYKLYKSKSIPQSIRLLIYSLWISIFVQSLAINLENTRGLWILVGILLAILNNKININDDLLTIHFIKWNKRDTRIVLGSIIICLAFSYTLFVDTAVKLKKDFVDISKEIVNLSYKPQEEGSHILRYYIDTSNIQENGTPMELKVYSKGSDEEILKMVQYDKAKGYGNLEFNIDEDLKEVQIELIGQDVTKVKDMKVITPSKKIIPVLNDYRWLSDNMFYKYQEKYKLVDEETLKQTKEKRKIFKQGLLPEDEQIILGNKVLYKGAKITELGDNKVKFEFIFECLEKMEWDYVFWMHINADDINIVSKEKKDGYINADHSLEIPTTSWEPGKTYVHTYIRELLPGEYNASFGFWLWKEAASDGKTHRLYTKDGKVGINIGWFDTSNGK